MRVVKITTIVFDKLKLGATGKYLRILGNAPLELRGAGQVTATFGRRGTLPYHALRTVGGNASGLAGVNQDVP